MQNVQNKLPILVDRHEQVDLKIKEATLTVYENVIIFIQLSSINASCSHGYGALRGIVEENVLSPQQITSIFCRLFF